MNFKTTILLAVILAALGGMYLVSKNAKPEAEATNESKNQLLGTSEISVPVFDGELGEIVKVTCRPDNGEEWVFALSDESGSTNRPDWRIEAPINAKAISWEVQRFATQLTELKHEISYEAGGDVDAEKAGLAPPNAVVTLTDKDGTEATFEIGHDASPSESYVRVAGSGKICLGQGVLSSLVKSNILDYRDQQLWSFNKDDAVRVEVTDRAGDTPTTYVLSQADGDWVFESPISAKATGKIIELIRTLGILRVSNWVDNREDRLDMYGLKPARYTVKVTTEKVEDPPRPETDEDEEPAPPPDPVVTSETYVIHVSDRSPIGEDTKVYVRAGDETATGVIMKTLADRFIPNMNEWRDMQIATANITAATRVEVAVPNAEATFIKHQRDWSFEADGSIAEGTSSAHELLVAINELEAVSFVDAPTPDLDALGFDNPQAVIKVSVPGMLEPERFTVGGYTDAQSKRLVYLRRNEGNAVAKVKVNDVAKLVRSPLEYRNLSLVSVSSDKFKSVRLQTGAACVDDVINTEFVREDNRWHMSQPVRAAVNEKELKTWVDQLAGLKGDAIVSDGGALSAYGLDAPTLNITAVYTPPKETRLERDEAVDADQETEALKSVEFQPDDVTVNILVASHQGKVYAMRTDRSIIYQVPPEFLRRATAEHRSPGIFDFNKDSVTAFTITQGDATFRFVRNDGTSALASESDLPLDPAKVDNLLLQLGDLVTVRFVVHGEDDSDRFGLDTPPMTASIELDGGEQLTLTVSASSCADDAARGRFATATGVAGVFLLTPDTLERLKVDLSALEK